MIPTERPDRFNRIALRTR